MKKGSYILGVLLAMSLPALSFADPLRMILQPNGNGSFTLTGERAFGVRELDIEVEYDSNLLLNPYVMINGGELKQVKYDTPGKLFISVFRPVADALLQVILYFDTRGDRAGGIEHISISSITRIPTPNRPSEQHSDSSSSLGNDGDEPSDGPADVSSLTRADKTEVKTNPAIMPDKNMGIETPSDIAGAAISAGPDKKTHAEAMTVLIYEDRSVLERFRNFRGEKNLNAFVALFAQCDDDRTVQAPAIAISDGKTPVTIRMAVEPEGMHPVGIALSSARLISKETNEKGIVITVLPNEGTWDTRLVVVTGRETLDYPLVVAPLVDFAGSVNENNFHDALQAYIINQPPALRRENKQYLSEYIFTANYLAGL